ncbi:hypothetical protein GCM10023142_23700 [Anaerocolumna aminovalerica]
MSTKGIIIFSFKSTLRKKLNIGGANDLNQLGAIHKYPSVPPRKLKSNPYDYIKKEAVVTVISESIFRYS